MVHNAMPWLKLLQAELETKKMKMKNAQETGRSAKSAKTLAPPPTVPAPLTLSDQKLH